jgi:hypothetical protein
VIKFRIIVRRPPLNRPNVEPSLACLLQLVPRFRGQCRICNKAALLRSTAPGRASRRACGLGADPPRHARVAWHMRRVSLAQLGIALRAWPPGMGQRALLPPAAGVLLIACSPYSRAGHRAAGHLADHAGGMAAQPGPRGPVLLRCPLVRPGPGRRFRACHRDEAAATARAGIPGRRSRYRPPWQGFGNAAGNRHPLMLRCQAAWRSGADAVPGRASSSASR